MSDSDTKQRGDQVGGCADVQTDGRLPFVVLPYALTYEQVQRIAALLGDPPAKGKEGTMDDKQLVEVLKESKEWAAAAFFLRTERGYNDRADDGVEGFLTKRMEESFTPDFADLLHRVRALRDEVQSGAVYGSEDHCCVCSGQNPTVRTRFRQEPHTWFWRCGGCSFVGLHESDGLPTAAAILRARRLLDERRAEQPVSPTVTVRPDTHIVARHEVRCTPHGTMTEIRVSKGDAVEQATTKEETTERRQGHNRCGLCGGGIYAVPDRDVYRCGTCGAEAIGVQVRYSGVAAEWRKPGTPSPTCWKCRRPNIIPAMIITSAPEGKRGDDERPLCYDCMRDNDAWNKEQDRLANIARDELDRPMVRRKEVPPWPGCSGDTSPDLDPRYRR